MNEKLHELLKVIESKPCVGEGPFGSTERVDAIEEELKTAGSPYHRIKGKKYYRLFAQKELEELKTRYSDIVVVSSHADNKQKHSTFEWMDNRNTIRGCCDNAVTNAVCTDLMIREDLPKNVVFAFTADEEYGSTGAEHVAKKLKEFFDEEQIRVIVLDVTYGFQEGADFTIENDFIRNTQYGRDFIDHVCQIANGSEYRWNFLFSTSENEPGFMSSLTIASHMGKGLNEYTLAKGPDETEEYSGAGLNTFSLCLPCSAEGDSAMHSEEGFLISLKTTEHYRDFLKQILENANQKPDRSAGVLPIVKQAAEHIRSTEFGKEYIEELYYEDTSDTIRFKPKKPYFASELRRENAQLEKEGFHFYLADYHDDLEEI
ncbi:MAG: M28 family peptidase [Lachnospiraceae bacterium]|nr:M28 family peptidase [Lachnospiraceae bacterium]